MNIKFLRKEYKKAVITTDSVKITPFSQFELWLNEAIESHLPEPTAMGLSTISGQGFPQSRIVLLKFFDEEGFVFFSNFNSQKGISLDNNPSVSLLFFWPELERQIRIEGYAEKVDQSFSEDYFHSRPPESRIGAWASEQSSIIPSRSYLEKRFSDFQKKFGNNPPLPDFWGGYRVKPVHFEFWQGRENRLHDRICYAKDKENWIIKRLAP